MAIMISQVFKPLIAAQISQKPRSDIKFPACFDDDIPPENRKQIFKIINLILNLLAMQASKQFNDADNPFLIKGKKFLPENEKIQIFVGDIEKFLINTLNKDIHTIYYDGKIGLDSVTITAKKGKNAKNGQIVILLDYEKLKKSNMAGWFASICHEIFGHVILSMADKIPKDRDIEELKAYEASNKMFANIIALMKKNKMKENIIKMFEEQFEKEKKMETYFRLRVKAKNVK